MPKSAYAAPGGRPTAQLHFDSMRVRRGIEDFEEIVVVDDIVTRGATLIAAAARLAEVYPGATVRAFAVARTKKMTGGIEEPCVGTISVNHGQCRRQP